MFENVVFHVDVNSAYLSWEAVWRLKHLGGRLDIRNIASAVGGDIALRRGIILAKSMPAKRYGVQTGDAIFEARRKCPEIFIVPPKYNLYERCSAAFINLLKRYTPKVEQYSIDECFMDMSGCTGRFKNPEAAAFEIKERIKAELGFTVNIGVGENKLLAKMASDFEKPDKVHTLYRHEIQKKMWPLPVSNLFFVGRATVGKLLKLGIKTIGDLAETDASVLKAHMKKHGEVIWAFANGVDVSAVQEAPPNKGYGNSTTIPFDVTDKDSAYLVLLGLAETLAMRLRAASVKAGLLSVGIKNASFAYASHQMVLDNATNTTLEIYKAACLLFDSLWDGAPIRQLGIQTGRLCGRNCFRQERLFEAQSYEKLEKLDRAVDDIRRRYGIDAVCRAAFLNTPIDHLSGGISREKRSVDYSRIEVL